jgi:hypothetical protein
MTRRIFLVGSPFTDKYSVFYRGVMSDANNFYRYFQSATGGAFQASTEIIYLENPTWEQLQQVLLRNSCDYAVLVFTGHGYFSAEKRTPVINLNPKETVTLALLRQKIQAPKKLVICDSCQVYVEDYEQFEGIGDPEYMNFTSSIPPQRARLLFNKAINNCQDGFQTLYSCSPGEESTLTVNGSLFTNALLSNIQGWSSQWTENTLMKTSQAFKLSERHLLQRSAAQTPQLRVSLSKPNYPLAAKSNSLMNLI